MVDMVDIYRVFHQTIRQYTFFLAVHGTFSKIDHILRYKASLNKFKKIKITPCIISDHNVIERYLNNKRIPRKCSLIEMNNTLLTKPNG
jgi:exonuclease III